MGAPATATISVIHNKTFAWAYGGMPSFGFEIFKQETTNAVLGAVLVVWCSFAYRNPSMRLPAAWARPLLHPEEHS